MSEPVNNFHHPDWVPRAEPGQRILVVGASGGLGRPLIEMLLAGSDCVVGAHGSTRAFESADRRVIAMRRTFESEADCVAVVDEFREKAGGIDALVALSGALHFSGHWKDMPSADWEKDIAVNLNYQFYLARRAMHHMAEQGSGGRVVLNSTESAEHGGSAFSFPYAIAKHGTECMVQGLAREGAARNILVNAVRLGYFASGFHQRWLKRNAAAMEVRRELVPLKRGGDPREAAAMVIYLLSGWARFITGQVFPLTGGDWL